MRRRSFLSAGLALAGTGFAGFTRGQMVTRAAVIIGVDRVSTFDPLGGAASGAARVAAWLGAEGFNTALLTDAVKRGAGNAANPAVTVKAIGKTTAELNHISLTRAHKSHIGGLAPLNAARGSSTRGPRATSAGILANQETSEGCPGRRATTPR